MNPELVLVLADVCALVVIYQVVHFESVNARAILCALFSRFVQVSLGPIKFSRAVHSRPVAHVHFEAVDVGCAFEIKAQERADCLAELVHAWINPDRIHIGMIYIY